MEDGYEFFAKRQLVTLFSAPNYCGEFDNAGAMMSVDETLMCSFQILKVSICFNIVRSIKVQRNLKRKEGHWDNPSLYQINENENEKKAE